MEYRTMDNIGAKTSLLGFGCMRFPTNADGSINEEWHWICWIGHIMPE